MRCDGSQKQLGAQSLSDKVGSDVFSGFPRAGARIEENDDRWTGPTESCTEDAGPPCQLLQTWEQGTERSAIRLVDAVFERGGEQRMTPLGEGGEQEHGVLDVDHGIGARIVLGEGAACFLGGKALIRDGEQQGPLPFRLDTGYQGFRFPRHAGDREAAHPTGGGVIGMVFTAGCLSDDFGISPAQTAKVIGQGDAGKAGGGGRSAALADRDVVLNPKGQRNDCRALGPKNLFVGFEDQVIFHIPADFPVASSRGN